MAKPLTSHKKENPRRKPETPGTTPGTTIKTSVLMMELRGFGKIPTDLAQELNTIGVSPERIRGAAIEIVDDILDQVSNHVLPLTRKLLGGDTWFMTFSDIHSALRFGISVLTALRHLANTAAIFFIKPSMAVTIGQPKSRGDNFLDDPSIKTYRNADKGASFRFVALGGAVGYLADIPWIKSREIDRVQGQAIVQIEWQDVDEDALIRIHPKIALPTILLDSEVIHSATSSQAIGFIIRQQQVSNSVYAFGGPAPLNDDLYKNYVRSSIKQLRGSASCKFHILSYIPLNEPMHSLSWLDLCRRLSIEFPSNFAFAAFPIPQGQLRPFSYHIYDESVVHIGLRSFSPMRGTPTLSSAIMFRHEKIAKQFKDEFMENWRQIGALTDQKMAHILAEIAGITPEVRRIAMTAVDRVLRAD